MENIYLMQGTRGAVVSGCERAIANIMFDIGNRNIANIRLTQILPISCSKLQQKLHIITFYTKFALLMPVNSIKAWLDWSSEYLHMI